MKNTGVFSAMFPFLYVSAFALCCAAPLCAQFPGLDGTRSELLRYIQSESADASCGVCLGAAQKFFNEQKKNELLKKTEGMVLVPAGKYSLGSPDGVGDPDERPSADIALDGFYIDTAEVTISEYMLFARDNARDLPEWAAPGNKFNMESGKDPYYRRLKTLVKTCGSCPVFGVSWDNANAYCAANNKRLPTEAEWEAAARGGSGELYPFGSSAAAAAPFAWTEGNSAGAPHPIARKKPNKYGIHDMQGNVWEWALDMYEKGYYASRPGKNPANNRQGREHIIRGGSWASDIDSTRPGNRASARDANDDIGFRCAVAEKAVQQRNAGF
ncbi:MAG: hypothetical protein A2234_05685 [Elusimicrobia bacterium RIFOXYA2_FULL_58_8]|nr:MAG: hypothetical protein A2285_10675 [Elusimicrobia bacterium RIFOXYA12_FULL_57_11]OGS13799.1 MAG: hypothetical protein A2234_05685 [Elusimicrobia bacterium RIFOXYA2_FULL_58_8]